MQFFDSPFYNDTNYNSNYTDINNDDTNNNTNDNNSYLLKHKTASSIKRPLYRYDFVAFVWRYRFPNILCLLISTLKYKSPSGRIIMYTHCTCLLFSLKEGNTICHFWAMKEHKNYGDIDFLQEMGFDFTAANNVSQVIFKFYGRFILLGISDILARYVFSWRHDIYHTV